MSSAEATVVVQDEIEIEVGCAEVAIEYMSVNSSIEEGTWILAGFTQGRKYPKESRCLFYFWGLCLL